MTPEKENLSEILNTVYIFVIGDKATGKTSLIRAFTNTRIKETFMPSSDYVYTYTHWIMRGPLELRITEHVSPGDRTWNAYVNNAICPAVPSALVCNKIDLRSHPFYNGKMHLLLDGDAVNGIRQSCGISSSFECSAMTYETVDELFIGAEMLAYKYTPYA
ncbi:hypothetical protein CEXT_189651 [Caerostris extrusa]|uniref:Uncharacterized protein n=1 Tax=Caerostris extrusa TaxID=172846 RepID=A0AAV4X2H3_CAEEX|nr:hypothetical protein CEXT_189651 [Caerostris extrusa]